MCKDPFRLCFPVALTLALYGSLQWVSFALFQASDYPGLSHARIFIGGFLYYSIFGFLMTAVPRFTQTSFLNPFELGLLLLHILVTMCLLVLDMTSWWWLSLALGWPMLFVFAIRRFLRRGQNPPFTFLFVGIGMLLGFLGSTAFTLSSLGLEPVDRLLQVGKVCFYDAMVLSLIIGVGGRLVPGILGFEEIVVSQRKVYESPKPFYQVVPISIYFAAILFLTSVVLEISSFFLAAFLLRALIVTFVAIRFWQLHKSPPKKTWHGRFVRFSCMFLVVGSWLLVFLMDQTIATKHFLYIGGYALLTLLVAGRVTMAHSSQGLDIEKRRYPYLVVGMLISVAAITRATANYIPDSYIRHLGYAGMIFFAGALFWGIVFVPRIFRGMIAKS